MEPKEAQLGGRELPCRFLEETKGRRHAVTWSPQEKVLMHLFRGVFCESLWVEFDDRGNSNGYASDRSSELVGSCDECETRRGCVWEWCEDEYWGK
ncbi:UDP-glycosyltransferase 84B2-like [Senna tora]|uniref:UDP-glycosyltransferase 84B2-like n=1 Tax=Senna tora TaxID=362788 RepID=A0A834ST76_9FABA|nr:UDP-glycosyltransferase 84B2-like [Senna tora]